MGGFVMRCSQSEMLAKYASHVSVEVRKAAQDGVCTALCCLFAKLSPLAKSDSDIVKAFEDNEQTCIKEQITALQFHNQNNTGYDYIFKFSGLTPKTNDFVVLTQGCTINLVLGEPCIHTFNTGVGAEVHTICHARLTNNALTTFDPNYGILAGNDTDWHSDMLGFLALAYPGSSNHRAVVVKA